MSRNTQRATESTPTTTRWAWQSGVSAEVEDMVGVIFRLYGRTFAVKFHYFPSVQTLIQQMAPHYCPKYYHKPIKPV